MQKRPDAPPTLSKALLEEGHTHRTVVQNCMENLLSGRHFNEWVKFMKEEYDMPDNMVGYVKKRVAKRAHNLNLLN